MTLEIGILFGVLAVMAALFLTEKLPVDLTAFLGLAVLIFAGFLDAGEAFSGFASTAVITMLSIFIISGALLRTGVADAIGDWAHRLVGAHERRLVVMLMLVAGGLSAFMNNIAAVAVMMPAVSSLARRAELSPSRLFMPLSFGAILGGTTTLVGTPPNIVAGALLEEHGLPPLSLFDFSPAGVLLLLAGVAFMITLGRRMLPDRARDTAAKAARDLAAVYGLQERLFSIRVPQQSHLDGRSLEEARLGATLGLEVLAIQRGERRIHAPDRHAALLGGDVLLVKGQRTEVSELARVQGVVVKPTNVRALPRLARGVSGVRVALAADCPLTGKTLREAGFRGRYGLIVVGIVRGGQLETEDLGRHLLAEGDELIALGPRPALQQFAEERGFEPRAVGYSALSALKDRLFLIRVDAGSPMEGRTIAETRIGETVGVTVGGLVRDGVTRLAISADEKLEAGDQLVVAGESWHLLGLVELGEMPLEDAAIGLLGPTDETGVVEAALAPRSSLVGKSLRELDFKAHYGLQALSIWSGGRAYRTHLTDRRLQFGDALLLQGSWEAIARLGRDADFVLLSRDVETPRRTEKAVYAVGGLLLMIALVVSGLQPIHVAAFTAAALTLLSGALRMEEAYRVIEWRAIFLVAAVLPVGVAMERTGAALLLADAVTATAGPLGPYAVLAALALLSSLLSQALDGAPAVVLLAPVVMKIAAAMEINPVTLLMAVALAASAAFMTPFSHKANLLVMGAGGYVTMDYVRVGAPLTAIVLALIVLVVPVIFPF